MLTIYQLCSDVLCVVLGISAMCGCYLDLFCDILGISATLNYYLVQFIASMQSLVINYLYLFLVNLSNNVMSGYYLNLHSLLLY